MNALDRALEEGFGQLRARLAGETAERREATLDALRELHAPGLFVLLAARGTAPGEGGDGLLRGAAAALAEAPALEGAGLDAARIERILRALLVERAPAEDPGERALERRVAELAVGVLAEHAKLTPGDARAVAQLLGSGEFFGDVAASTASVLRSVPRLPLALVRDVAGLPHRTIRLAAALTVDLAGTPFQAPAVLADLLDGRLDHSPTVLRRTLRALYGFASLANVLETLHTLLAPDNRTLRLALLLYARANGIPLEEADLDRLQELFASGSPGLGPALAAAVERLRERENADGALRLLRRFERRDVG